MILLYIVLSNLVLIYIFYRSWSPHSLPVTCIDIFECKSVTRIISVSLDRNIIIHDLFSNKQYFYETLPESIECCVVNPTYDSVFCGTSSGKIYIVDLSVNSYMLSNAHTKSQHSLKNEISANKSISENALIGHDKSVSSLAISSDAYTLVSASHDGSVKVWNIISRQCIQEIIPFNKNPLSNVKVLICIHSFLLNLGLLLNCSLCVSQRCWIADGTRMAVHLRNIILVL